MSKEVAILDQGADHHKAPWALTDTEVFQLMQAFTADKPCIAEEDALTLGRWAEHRKRGAYILGLVLAGHLCVTVHAGAVSLGLPAAASGRHP